MEASLAEAREKITGDLACQLLSLYGRGVSSADVRRVVNLLSGVPEGSDPATLLEFGPTEFSLSFATDREAPAVRCLSETLSSQRITAGYVDQAYRIGRLLLENQSPEGHVHCGVELFRDIFDIVYRPISAADSASSLRFGLAAEWTSGRVTSAKSYFDLHSNGRSEAYERLHAVFERLGFRRQWSRASDILDEIGDRAACRGIGLDFSLPVRPNVRLYLPGSLFTLESVATLVPAPSLPYLRLFNQLILGAKTPMEPLKNTLMGLVFSEALLRYSDEPIVKLDVWLPAYKADELASYTASARLMEHLGLRRSHYLEAIGIFKGESQLDELQRVQQFLSVDFLPNERYKANIYFRPAEIQPRHLHPERRPRVKPRSLRRVDGGIRCAIEFLEGQRSCGYREAVHRMSFPRAVGFSGVTDIQEGLTYQLSVICIALMNAAAAGFDIDWPGIESDLAKLLALRSPEYPYAWAYFPLLPELPQDTDDLAQVIQVLCRLKPHEVSALCEPAIQLLMSQNRHSDGALGTWLVDYADNSETNRRKLRAIRAMWGDAGDVEVTANLLFALWLWAPERFATQIEEGVQFIAQRQRPNGSWLSQWYCGPYYGTYVCLRILQRVCPNHHCVLKSLEFLRASQLPNGGWGEGAANATDTAFGLMGINELRTLLGGDLSPMDHALSYLLDAQLPDGRWAGSDLIRMDVNRVRSSTHAGTTPPLTYQSDILTSAFVLDALSAIRSVVDSGPGSAR